MQTEFTYTDSGDVRVLNPEWHSDFQTEGYGRRFASGLLSAAREACADTAAPPQKLVLSLRDLTWVTEPVRNALAVAFIEAHGISTHLVIGDVDNQNRRELARLASSLAIFPSIEEAVSAYSDIRSDFSTGTASHLENLRLIEAGKASFKPKYNPREVGGLATTPQRLEDLAP